MITKEKFERFVKVQASGACNMLNKEVQQLADLTKEEHIEIINHYSVYEELYDIHVENYKQGKWRSIVDEENFWEVYVKEVTDAAHQEQSNEDFFECMNDYFDGTMCV